MADPEKRNGPVSTESESEDCSPRPSRTERSVGGEAFIAMLVLFGAFLIASMIAEMLLRGERLDLWRMLLTLCLSWPVTLTIVARRSDLDLARTFSLRAVAMGRVAEAFCAGLALSVTLLSLATWLPGEPPSSATTFHESVRSQSRVPLYVAMLLIGPVAEELFFRGWMLPRLMRRSSTSVAIIVTAVLFATLHFLSWQVLFALPVGILFGYITWRSESVLPAIASHVGVNLAPVLIEPLLALAGFSSADVEAMSSIPFRVPLIASLGFLVALASFRAHGAMNPS